MKRMTLLDNQTIYKRNSPFINIFQIIKKKTIMKGGKDLNRHFINEDINLANTHMK